MIKLKDLKELIKEAYSEYRALKDFSSSIKRRKVSDAYQYDNDQIVVKFKGGQSFLVSVRSYDED